ncbi:MAG: PEP-CTERM sorting domain-containing protein [Gammaproteobacteria bacterium]|nr:PEP-CTERM sorting domain-containing protein [Gammaproteobacteria bacterium]MBP6608489.1 PEP-CTERM sorting domain-containing protein [Deltaproteobacteria bacterium]MBK6585023.1 PEP-CTERM sorting domain-containing protein [Gammaproteobacteria bacterium]MBK7520264.1 PEP-CTERM sorting domain-containing protein [Gammaproteobacteria bacterium]MBK7729515.1 PEP-CTERM sorting domain-containing protein [Gammaproteobacteria bacterium]
MLALFRVSLTSWNRREDTQMFNYLKHTVAVALTMASAAVMASHIDLTDPASLGAVSVSAFGGNVTSNTSASERSGCVAAGAGLACLGDGVGIGDDEVTFGREVLTVDLGKAYRVNSVEFLDVFNNANEGGKSEHAQFSIDGGSIFDAFRGAADGSGDSIGGYLMFSLSQPVVGQTLRFFTTSNARSDFSVARISVSEVPLPGTLGLLGLGLVGLGAVRKKHA